MKELIINIEDDVEKIFLLENGVLTEKYIDSKYKKRLEGNIYIGKVQNIIPGLQAAFINVGENKNAFIHLKDVLPKKNIVEEDAYNLEQCDIRKVLKPGMPIIVEIKRDSYNKKGARASTHINLPGRYLVLLPNATFVTVSQKIEDNQERNRLIELVKNIIPKNMGAIIRTSAEGKSGEDISMDLDNLINKWNDIISVEFDNQDFPKLIYKSNEVLDKLLIDIMDKELEKIIVNTEEMKNKILEKLELWNKSDVEVVLDNRKLEEYYDLNKQIEVSENRKIWLKSGGFITIDKTEALTAIDVNSAKFVGKSNLEETAFAINKESAVEIAKQIRLRDIGGIIIIDFIDLKDENNKKELVEIFKEQLKKERTKVQIEGFTKLNLLELTRKHICSE
ncbi:MAG: Rne/Rng family ribonuclease [Clostridia bacterium]|jgi:ribonuclease G|nr:Rne/Rng family ribonuclease [Clostridia bacterium]